MSFCTNCKTELSEADLFCPECGQAKVSEPTSARVSRPIPTVASSADQPESVSSAAKLPGGRRGLRTGWMVGGGCLGLLLIGFVLFIGTIYFASGGATDAAKTHFEMLKSGEVDLAWRNTSEAFRSVTPVESYRALVASRPDLGQIATISVPDRQIENGIATLLVRLTTTNGATYDVPIQARKETDERWRISALDFSALPAAQPGGNASPPPGRSSPVGSSESTGPVGLPPFDPVIQQAMTAADDFYAWYLAKWEEPDIEPAWFENSERLTPGFRSAWTRVQQRGVRPGEEPALDYDLVMCAPEVPYGGFRAIHGEPGPKPNSVRVIILGVGWDMTLDVRMLKNNATGAWQVDAIENLNQDLSVLPELTIPDSRRSEATLAAIFELLKDGEPWQVYALATSGFGLKVSPEDWTAFVERTPAFKSGAPPVFRETSAGPLKRIYTIEMGGGRGECVLTNEAEENVWGLHRLTWGGDSLGAIVSPALDIVIGEVVMGNKLDPVTRKIIEENSVFDAAVTNTIWVDVPISNAYPNLKVNYTVSSIDSGRVLIDSADVAPENINGDWLWRSGIERSGKPWSTGDYELVISIEGGPMRREIFGVR